MSLADFSKAYLQHKRNKDVPDVELKGFTAKDFEDFEVGIAHARECHRQGREPEMPDMPPDMNQWAIEVKNRLAAFFRAYDVYRSNPGVDVDGFTVQQFEEFEANVNSICPGLLPGFFPTAEEANWVRNHQDYDYAGNFLNDLKL
jgi:hypothetical protein